MANKVQIDDIDVAKYQVLRKALEDDKRLNDEMRSGLNSILSYLDSAIQKGKVLSSEEANAVESIMKRIQALGEYNKLLKSCNKDHKDIVNDFALLLDLQEKLNEEVKANRDATVDIAKYASDPKVKEYLDGLHIDNTTKYKDAAPALKKLIDGGSRANKELLSASAELDKVNSKLSKTEMLVSSANKHMNNARQVLGAIKDTIASISEDWRKFNDIAAKTSREMGLSLNNLRAYQTTMMRDVASFGMQYGLAYDDMDKFQRKYSEVTQRNMLMNRENKETFGAMHVLIGDEAFSTAVGEFDKLGGGLETSATYLMKQYDVATKMGLNANQAVNIMNKNLSMANKYSFKDGVNGFQRMALLSQQLRMNMESVGAVIEKSSSLEGAIDMAASMQVLGGSYAAQFGNPLQVLYESLNDAEGMAERIRNTFADKANFNYKTGMADISNFNRAMMREAAKNMGYSFDEALNIANREAVRRESMRYMNSGLSETDKDLLANLAQYNVERQRFEVTYFGEDNKERTVDIANISASDIKYIKNNIVNDDLNGNVRDIHRILREQFGHKAKSLVSMNESITGAKTSWSAMKGMAEDGVMQKADGIIKDGAEWIGGLSNNWLYGLGTLGLGYGLIKGGLSIAGRTADFVRGFRSGSTSISGSSLPGSTGTTGATGNLTPPPGPTTTKPSGGWYKVGGRKMAIHGNEIHVEGVKTPISANSPTGKILAAEIKAAKGGLGATGKVAAGSKAALGLKALKGSGAASGVISGIVTGIEEFGGDNNHTTGQKALITGGSAVGGGLGAWGGAALGAAALGAISAGTLAPLGALIGGALGGWGGSEVGKNLMGKVSGADKSENVKPHPLDNGTAGPMFSGDINVHVNGTIKIKYPDGASQELAKELQKPEIRQAIKNIVVSELAKANAHGGTIDMGSQQMQINGVGLT